MPKRQNTRRVKTPKLQGDDSFVEIRLLTFEEHRKLREEADKEQLSNWDYGKRLMALSIAEWNWVDNDGKPLPEPRIDPDVVDRLTEEEMMFLTGLLKGRPEEELKN